MGGNTSPWARWRARVQLQRAIRLYGHKYQLHFLLSPFDQDKGPRRFFCFHADSKSGIFSTDYDPEQTHMSICGEACSPVMRFLRHFQTVRPAQENDTEEDNQERDPFVGTRANPPDFTAEVPEGKPSKDKPPEEDDLTKFNFIPCGHYEMDLPGNQPDDEGDTASEKSYFDEDQTHLLKPIDSSSAAIPLPSRPGFDGPLGLSNTGSTYTPDLTSDTQSTDNSTDASLLSTFTSIMETKLLSFFGGKLKGQLAVILTTGIFSLVVAVIGLLVNLFQPEYKKVEKINIGLFTASVVSSLTGLLVGLAFLPNIKQLKHRLTSAVTQFISFFKQTERAQGDDIRSTGAIATHSTKFALMLGLAVLNITNPAITAKVHNINSSCGDIHNTFEAVSKFLYDVGGIDIDNSREFDRLVCAYRDTADNLCAMRMEEIRAADLVSMKEHQGKMNALIQRAMKSDKVALLSGAFQKLSDKIVEVTKTLQNRRPSPETVTVYFEGKPGVGKSKLAKEFIPSQLNARFGVDDQLGRVVSLRVNTHNQIYTGQYWGVFDEFGNDKEAPKNLGGWLNELTSSGGAVFQGAGLETKEQQSAFRAVFFVSNVAEGSVETGLHKEAKEAFFSRVIHVKVLDKRYDEKQARHAQPHRRPDYSHLELEVSEGHPRKANGVKTVAGLLDFLSEKLVEKKHNVTNLSRANRTQAQKQTRWLQNGVPFDLEIPEAGYQPGPKVVTLSGRPEIGKTTSVKASLPQAAWIMHKRVEWITTDKMLLGCVPRPDSIYVLDDALDYSSAEGQKDYANFFDRLPQSSSILNITNYIPNYYKHWNLWRLGGTKTAAELRPGFYRRMGWVKDAFNAVSFIKTADRYLPVFDSFKKCDIDEILVNLYVSPAEGHVIFSPPAEMKVTPANADLYLQMPAAQQVNKAKLTNILRTNCRSVHLAKTILEVQGEIDLGGNEVSNIARIFSKYYDKMKDYKFCVQIGNRTCIIQDQNLYITGSDTIGYVDKHQGILWHFDSRQRPTHPVDPELFRKFRSGSKPLGSEEFREFFLFSGYQFYAVGSYMLLDSSISFTWTEIWNKVAGSGKSLIEGFATFVDKHFWLLALLTSIVFGITMLSKLQSIDVHFDEFAHFTKNHSHEVKDITVANARQLQNFMDCVYWLYVDQKDYIDCCHKYGVVPTFADEDTQAKGKNKGGRGQVRNRVRQARRACFYINGKKYYDDDIEEGSEIHHKIQAALDAVQRRERSPYMDIFGNEHFGYEYMGEQYFISVSPRGTNLIYAANEVAQAGKFASETTPPRDVDRFEKILNSNVKILRCYECRMESVTTFLSDSVCVAPLHVICHPQHMYVVTGNDQIDLKLFYNRAETETAFLKTTSLSGKTPAIPGVKNLSGNLISEHELHTVQEATICVRRGPVFRYLTSNYKFYQVFPYGRAKELEQWRQRVGTVTYATTSNFTMEGDCGTPYMAINRDNQLILLGVHASSLTSPKCTTSVVLTTETVSEALRVLNHTNENAESSAPSLTEGLYETNLFSPNGVSAYLLPEFQQIMRPVGKDYDGLCPFGPALETVARVPNRVPYDPNTTRTVIEPPIDHDLGPPRIPALNQKEALEQYPEQIPEDARGNKHLAYVRLQKGESNCWNMHEWSCALAETAAVQLAEFDKINLQIRTPIPLQPLKVVNGRKGQEPMKLKGKSAGTFSQIMHSCHYKSDYFEEKPDGTLDYADSDAGRWLRTNVARQHKAACNGIRIVFPVTAGLKSELLAPEKVWKKRVFQNDHICNVINTKRFLQPLLAEINKQGPKTPYALALAPRVDSHTMIEDLLAFGVRLTDLDFGSFDLTVPAPIVMASYSYVAQFYVDRPEFPDIQRALLVYGQNVAFNPILVGESLIRKEGGVSSGIEATSFIDSICVRLTLYILLSAHEQGIEDRSSEIKLLPASVFAKIAKTKGNGDDTLISWGEGKWVKFSVLKKLYKSLFGMTVTTPAKSEDDQGRERASTVHEVSFCSRTFVKEDGCPFWQSRLKADAVSSALTFTRHHETETYDILEQLQAQLWECVAWGPKHYQQIALSTARYSTLCGVTPCIDTYSDALVAVTESIKDATSSWQRGIFHRLEPEKTLAFHCTAALNSCSSVQVPSSSDLNSKNKVTPKVHSIKIKKTNQLEIPKKMASAATLIRAWRKEYNAGTTRSLRTLLEYSGAQEALELSANPTQVIRIGTLRLTIPTLFSVSCFKYIMEPVPSSDVQNLATLSHALAPAAQALEELRKQNIDTDMDPKLVYACLIIPDEVAQGGTHAAKKPIRDPHEVMASVVAHKKKEDDKEFYKALDGITAWCKDPEVKVGSSTDKFDSLFDKSNFAERTQYDDKEGHITRITFKPDYTFAHLAQQIETFIDNRGVRGITVAQLRRLPVYRNAIKDRKLSEVPLARIVHPELPDKEILLPLPYSWGMALAMGGDLRVNWECAWENTVRARYYHRNPDAMITPEDLERLLVSKCVGHPGCYETAEGPPPGEASATAATAQPTNDGAPAGSSAVNGGDDAAPAINLVGHTPMISKAVDVAPPATVHGPEIDSGHIIAENAWGIRESELTTQMGSMFNVLYLASTSMFTGSGRMVTGSDRNVVIKEGTMYPWDKNLLHPWAYNWANQHGRFNGSFKVKVTITSTPTIYGNVGLAIIPPAWVATTKNTEEDLSKFKNIDSSLERSSEMAFSLMPMNRDDTPLMFIKRDDEAFAEDPFRWGKWVLWLTTDTATAFDSKINITFRYYFEFNDDAVYWFPLESVTSSAGNAPVPPTGPGVLIITDGETTAPQAVAAPSRYVNPATENPTGTYGYHGLDGTRVLVTWVPREYTQIEPSNHNTTYPDVRSALFREFDVYGDGSGGESSGRGGVYVGTGGEDTTDVRKQSQGFMLYLGLTPNFPASQELTIAYGQRTSNPGYENVIPLLVGGACYVPKYAHYDERLRPRMPRGVVGVLLSAASPNESPNKQIVITNGNQAGYPVKSWDVGTTGVYCSQGYNSPSPNGKPATFKKVTFVPDSGLIPGVLDGVTGITVPPTETDNDFQTDIRDYFEDNPNIAALIYRGTVAGTPIGSFVANADGFWVSRTEAYETFSDPAASVTWEVAPSPTKWPATDVDIGSTVPRLVSAYTPSAFSFFKGAIHAIVNEPIIKENAELIRENLKHKLQKNDEETPILQLMREQYAYKSLEKPEAGVSALGGVLKGAGEGLSSAGGAMVQMKMQGKQQAHEKAMMGIKHISQMKQIEATIGKQVTINNSQTAVNNDYKNSYDKLPVHQRPAISRNDPLRQGRGPGARLSTGQIRLGKGTPPADKPMSTAHLKNSPLHRNWGSISSTSSSFGSVDFDAIGYSDRTAPTPPPQRNQASAQKYAVSGLPQDVSVA